MDIIVAGSLWLLVVIFTFRVRSRPTNTLYWAILLLALAMTLNAEPPARFVDAVVPIASGSNLLGNLAMVWGLGLLLRSIRVGAMGRDSPAPRHERRDRIGLALTVMTMIVTFAMIDRSGHSATFMLDYGDQPAAALFSTVQFVYLAIVLLLTCLVCVRNMGRLRKARYRISARLLVIGCVLGLTLSALTFVMNGAHVMGHLDLMHGISVFYDITRTLAVLFLVLGLGIPPAIRIATEVHYRWKLARANDEVHAIWSATAGVDGSGSGTALPNHGEPRGDPSSGVHRMIIEIHDWANVTDTPERVSDEEWQKVLRAERLCLRPPERL